MAVNLRKCRFGAVHIGLVDFEFAASITGYQTPDQAEAEHDLIYEYIAQAGADFSEWEKGEGRWDAVNQVLVRLEIEASSAEGGGKVDFSEPPIVIMGNATNVPRVTPEVFSEEVSTVTDLIENESGGLRVVIHGESGRTLQQAVNCVLNNTFDGVGAGTPGTWPDSWFPDYGDELNLYGMSSAIIGAVVENGVECIDWRFSGLATAGSRGWIGVDALSGWPGTDEERIAVTPGDYVTISGYLKLIAGTIDNIGMNLSVNFQDANGNWTHNDTFTVTDDITADLVRYSKTVQAQAGDAWAYLALFWGYDTGLPIEITTRIGVPQLEKGASATSVQRTPRALRIATQNEAEAATSNIVIMTPQRVKQLLAVLPSYNQQTFLSTGTWEKPDGFPATSLVRIQVWGPGAGGSRVAGTNATGGGSGGGGYNEHWCTLADLADTEDVTIGLGGAARSTNGAGNPGQGPTSFGSIVSAYQGAPGTVSVSGADYVGGGGGGPLGPGSNSSKGGEPYGIFGDGYVQNQGYYYVAQGGFWHGGGGGSVRDGFPAGGSIWGGGGGQGCSITEVGPAAGKSVNGGDGGNAGVNGANGQDGEQPGGGGGACEGTSTAVSGKGGDGKAVITVWRGYDV